MPEQSSAPIEAPKKLAFEAWGAQKLKLIVSENGRASAVKNGRKVAKIADAATFNAARAQQSIPLGKLMSEAEFDAAMVKAGVIEINQ
jgi:hypothetical protein